MTTVTAWTIALTPPLILFLCCQLGYGRLRRAEDDVDPRFMCRCSSETTAFGFPALIFRLNRNQSETEEQCLNTNPEDRIQFLYQKILLLHLLPKMGRSVSFSVPEALWRDADWTAQTT